MDEKFYFGNSYSEVEVLIMKTSIIGAEASKAEREYNVLYIEPNADCRSLVEVLLRLFGYVVISACDADTAKEILVSRLFDAYILNNSPFDQSGIELCRYICVLDAEAQVIFYSGAAYTYNIEQGLAAGAKKYLTKPCGIEILTDTVARLIHSKKLHKLHRSRK
jgi:DNA-binding response OmpR family regulator